MAISGSTSRWSLVGLLAGVATAELVLNRILARVIHVDLLLPRSLSTRIADLTGLFLFMVLSVLSLSMLGAALGWVAVRGSEFRASARATFPLVGAVFLALGILGVMFRLPPNLAVHLRISFVFLTLLFAMAALASRAPGRVRVGVLLVWTGVVLMLWPQLLARLPVAVELTPSGVEGVMLGGLAAFVIAGLLLAPPRGRIGAMIFAGLVVAAVAVLVRLDWEVARRLSLYGFGLELPVTPVGQLLVLAALGTWLYAVVRLCLHGGVQRLRGVGLLLVGTGGFALELPYQLATSALGFLCLAASAARVDGIALTREGFESIVRRAAAAVGAPNVTVTGPIGQEVSQVHAPVGTVPPVGVRFERHAGVLASFEVRVGESPPRDAALVVSSRDAVNQAPFRPRRDMRVQTEDAAFDRAFVVEDQRSAGAGLLDDDTRRRILELVDGWLGVWPQRGVVYRATHIPVGEEALERLLALLQELAVRAP